MVESRPVACNKGSSPAKPVDLNPVRPELAVTAEQIESTNAQERIVDLKPADEVSTPDVRDDREHFRQFWSV